MLVELTGRDGLPGSAGPPSNKEKKDLQDLSMEWSLTLDGEAEAAPMIQTRFTLESLGNIWNVTNFLCMPMDPDLDEVLDRQAHKMVSYIAAVGYSKLTTLAACSVCQAKKSTVINFPAKVNCPESWNEILHL